MNYDNPSVFVTYAWQNNKENNKVDNFVVALRQLGINAEYDKAMSYDNINRKIEIGFGKDKVIIILSENYKLKVDNKEGKVYEEWNRVYNDYTSHPLKYIFVSFDKDLSKENRKKITPNEFWALNNAGDILVYNINFNEDGQVINDKNLYDLQLRIWDLPEMKLPPVENNNKPISKEATGLAKKKL